MLRGSFSQSAHFSFALSPSKVILCALVCTTFESPVLSKQKQAHLYNYVLLQLNVSLNPHNTQRENGIIEKSLATYRQELTREADLADILTACVQDLCDNKSNAACSLDTFYTLFSKRVPAAIVHMTRHSDQPVRRQARADDETVLINTGLI